LDTSEKWIGPPANIPVTSSQSAEGLGARPEVGCHGLSEKTPASPKRRWQKHLAGSATSSRGRGQGSSMVEPEPRPRQEGDGKLKSVTRRDSTVRHRPTPWPPPDRAVCCMCLGPFSCRDMSGFELYHEIGEWPGSPWTFPVVIFTEKGLTKRGKTPSCTGLGRGGYYQKDVRSPGAMLGRNHLFLHRSRSNLPGGKEKTDLEADP